MMNKSEKSTNQSPESFNHCLVLGVVDGDCDGDGELELELDGDGDASGDGDSVSPAEQVFARN